MKYEMKIISNLMFYDLVSWTESACIVYLATETKQRRSYFVIHRQIIFPMFE